MVNKSTFAHLIVYPEAVVRRIQLDDLALNSLQDEEHFTHQHLLSHLNLGCSGETINIIIIMIIFIIISILVVAFISTLVTDSQYKDLGNAAKITAAHHSNSQSHYLRDSSGFQIKNSINGKNF